MLGLRSFTYSVLYTISSSYTLEMMLGGGSPVAALNVIFLSAVLSADGSIQNHTAFHVYSICYLIVYLLSLQSKYIIGFYL